MVEGKLYKKNETVKTIQTGIDGIATTTADLLPYGKYKLEETKAPEGYLTDGAKVILSILVDTFISKISLPMQPVPEIGSISGA